MKAFRQPVFFFVSVLGILAAAPAQGEGAEPRVALVQAKEGRLFCMEAETPDVTFPGRLPKGALVLVQAEGPSCRGRGTHFYKVTLPGGLEGYVFSRYVTLKGPGMGETNASRVLLRIGPSNQYFPVAPLPKGSPLRLLGRKGAWWHVLSPEDTPAWMRVKDLKILGPAHLFAKEIQKARQARLTQWKALLAAQAREAERAKKKAQAARSLSALEALLATERTKAPEAVDLSGVRKALAAFHKAWPEKTLKDLGLESRVNLLEKEIERLQLLHDTILARKKAEEELKKLGKPGRVKKPQPPPFYQGAFVGFLNRLEDPPYLTSYALFKGKRIVCYVRSRSGRYNLADFLGRYLLVKGDVSRPPSLQGAALVDMKRVLLLD